MNISIQICSTCVFELSLNIIALDSSEKNECEKCNGVVVEAPTSSANVGPRI